MKKFLANSRTARTARILPVLLFAASFFIFSGCETEIPPDGATNQRRTKIKPLGSDSEEAEVPSRSFGGE